MVGSQVCADCHQQICDTYADSHPMSCSIRMPNELDQQVKASLPVAFAAHERIYAIEASAEGMVQSESMTDQAGEIYKQTCQIDFAIGSGQRGHTFVFDRAGSLYQAPLTWYSERAKWDLSPGYDAPQHPRFERQISDGCVACHAGTPNRSTEVANKFNNPIFHEASIGCERCHGGGKQHVRFHRGLMDGATDSIVNPARLDSARRDSVCFQCHLHGKKRVLRHGREPYDFRPGDHFSDVWVAFVESASDGRSENARAVSQVEQMLASRCYQRSDGRLGCISCHDPHRIPAADERVEFFRRQCRECHSPAESDCTISRPERLKESPEDSCIQCHMPSMGASDVPHTSQTDHRVLRSYDRQKPAMTSPMRLEVFDEKNLPREAIQRAYGLMLAEVAQDQRVIAEAMSLLSPILGESVMDITVAAEAGWLLLKLGDVDSAQQLASRVLDVDPHNASALEILSQIHHARGQYDEALRVLNTLISQSPLNTTFTMRKAEVLMGQGQIEDAIITFRETLSINPLHSAARGRLIEALEQLGRTEEARSQLQQQKRIREDSDEKAEVHASE